MARIVTSTAAVGSIEGEHPVEETRFDALARSVGAGATRRSALRGVVAGLLGSIGLAAVLDDADAQNRRRRRRRNRRRSGRRNCGAQYAGCNTGGDCCTGLECRELRNPSAEQNFDGTCAYPVGCGKKNDFCEKNRDCCRRFRCRGRKCRRRNN
jgi:hypothetical protein